VYLAALGAVAAIGAGAAVVKPQPVPDAFKGLIDCRAISASDQRLACYDKQVETLDAAQKNKDIVVVSKAQVREARRSLFGFTLPNFSLFNGGKANAKEDKEAKAEEITRLETTLVSASQLRNGNWSLTLTEGGTWETTTELAIDPRAGDTVVINKASLGSYLGHVGANHGVRMRRVG
jgi:hypothetical protein